MDIKKMQQNILLLDTIISNGMLSIKMSDEAIGELYDTSYELEEFERLAELGRKVENGEIRTCMLKECRLGFSNYVKER